MSARKTPWSFRTRIAALIAVTFITGGAVLLGVQYLLVRGLFDTALSGISGCIYDAGTSASEHSADGDCSEILDVDAPAGANQTTVSTDGAVVLIEQTTTLSQEVLSGLLLWSVVTLLVFTGVALIAATWLSKKSFVRIGQITQTTKGITRNDLHQRLELPGPADEIKELGDTIDTMLDGLEASFTQQERFIMNASHELRTPLTTTRTALEIPLEQGKVPAHLEPAIRRALAANERSEQLIAVLLRLARTTVSDAEEEVDLAVLLAEGVAQRSEAIEAMGLTVSTDLVDAVVAPTDRALLLLALDNLLDNAIRHNMEGGELRVSCGTDDDLPWFEIENSGGSLTVEEAALLTEPFNRGPATRTAGAGLGLGLTLVQSIADSLGYGLQVVPRGGGGVVVRVVCGDAGRLRASPLSSHPVT